MAPPSLSSDFLRKRPSNQTAKRRPQDFDAFARQNTYTKGTARFLYRFSPSPFAIIQLLSGLARVSCVLQALVVESLRLESGRKTAFKGVHNDIEAVRSRVANVLSPRPKVNFCVLCSCSCCLLCFPKRVPVNTACPTRPPAHQRPAPPCCAGHLTRDPPFLVLYFVFRPVVL